MQQRFAISVVVALAVAAVPVLAAEDAFVGTWKLNAAKSKFSPGPAPKSSVVTIEPGGKVSVKSVSADGQEMNWAYTAIPDGEAAITGMEGATVVEKRVDDRTVEHTWNFGGQGKMSGRGVLAKNGKTMTYTLTGTNAKGETVHNVEIYGKQ
jgi:hypothetical protein